MIGRLALDVSERISKLWREPVSAPQVTHASVVVVRGREQPVAKEGRVDSHQVVRVGTLERAAFAGHAPYRQCVNAGTAQVVEQSVQHLEPALVPVDCWQRTLYGPAQVAIRDDGQVTNPILTEPAVHGDSPQLESSVMSA